MPDDPRTYLLSAENNINGENLMDMDQVTLKDMGVKKIGDRVRIGSQAKLFRNSVYRRTSKRSSNRVCQLCHSVRGLTNAFDSILLPCWTAMRRHRLLLPHQELCTLLRTGLLPEPISVCREPLILLILRLIHLVFPDRARFPPGQAHLWWAKKTNTLVHRDILE